MEADQDNKSSPSSKESQESPNWKSRLIDALTLLSSSASASCLMDKQTALGTIPPQVPLIVLQAIEHLECYGESFCTALFSVYIIRWVFRWPVGSSYQYSLGSFLS